AEETVSFTHRLKTGGASSKAGRKFTLNIPEEGPLAIYARSSSKDATNRNIVIANECGVTGEKPLLFFLERYMDAYAKEVKCFIDAIEKKTNTPLGVMDGLQPVLMGLAAKKSLKEHRPVKISEIKI
ncbi:MAG: hypothetical protein MJ199_02010, partial [Bacilli bacterium]|nr:hypothetical protein [Bacilli bacterium]